jgi:hypothetical protein
VSWETIPLLVSGQLKLCAFQLTVAFPSTFCTMVIVPLGAIRVAVLPPSTFWPM